MTARLLRLLFRLPRATDHDTSNRALFKYREAFKYRVILATYIGARYNLNT